MIVILSCFRSYQCFLPTLRSEKWKVYQYRIRADFYSGFASANGTDHPFLLPGHFKSGTSFLVRFEITGICKRTRFLFLSLELLKGIITDRVLHFTGFGLGGTGVNPCSGKLIRKILVALIELFCNLPTQIKSGVACSHRSSR